MTMIERIARALADASVAMQDAENSPTRTHLSFDDLPARERRWMIAFAKASLIAMRDPTPDMLRAGQNAETKTSPFVFSSAAAYRAMIDEALTP